MAITRQKLMNGQAHTSNKDSSIIFIRKLLLTSKINILCLHGEFSMIFCIGSTFDIMKCGLNQLKYEELAPFNMFPSHSTCPFCYMDCVLCANLE